MKMSMKTNIRALGAIALVCGMAFAGQAAAHGAVAKHGGVVSSASDLAFELVSKDGKAVIYIEDHGREVPTSDVTGKLTVLQNGKKSQSALAPAEDNTLASTQNLTLARGTKVVASIALPGKDPISVRFVAK